MRRYEQFVRRFMEQLKLNIEYKDVKVVRFSYVKANEVLDAVAIKYPDLSVAPVLYLGERYSFFCEGYTLDGLAEITAIQLNNIRRDIGIILEISRETAKKNLYCAVIHRNTNKELLKNVPYEKIVDLAIIPRFRVGDNGSFIVSNIVCQKLKMTSEEVMEQAHINTTKREEFEIQSMNERVRAIMRAGNVPEEYINELIDTQGYGCPLYILTNKRGVDGSVALISKDILESVYELVKGNYYVIPNSRHELILIPENTVLDFQYFRELVKEINTNETSLDDRLSDCIYKYDGDTKKMNVVDWETETLPEIKDGMNGEVKRIEFYEEYIITYMKIKESKFHQEYIVDSELGKVDGEDNGRCKENRN